MINSDQFKRSLLILYILFFYNQHFMMTIHFKIEKNLGLCMGSQHCQIQKHDGPKNWQRKVSKWSKIRHEYLLKFVMRPAS